MFFIYINDCPQIIRYRKYDLYSDDLQIYLKSSSRDLSQSMNPSKSQSIVTGNPKLIKKLNIDMIPKPTLNGVQIPLSNSVNNLGVYFNENLQWSQQVTNICKKVYLSLQTLRRLGNFLPSPLKAQLVKSIIMPHFDYGDIIYQDLPGKLTLKLQRAQNSTVRCEFLI